MRIKRFEGKTFAAAMMQVKKEMGKDAVIISTETLDGKTSITAAADYDTAPRGSVKTMPEGMPVGMPAAGSKKTGDMIRAKSYNERVYAEVASSEGAVAAAVRPVQNTAYKRAEELMPLSHLDNQLEIEGLKDEINRQRQTQGKQESLFLKELAMLRESLSMLLRETVGRDNSMPVAYTPYLKAGLEAGIERDILISLLSGSSSKETEIFVDEKDAKENLKKLISSQIKIVDLYKEMDERGGIFAFVGPTGVGKTTTLAKIAANLTLMREREDIAVISMDFLRADGCTMLKRYADILGVPFFRFTSPEAYFSDIVRIKERYKIVLLDTAGVSPLNRKSLEFLAKVCKNNYTHAILHIPVATEYEQAVSIIDIYNANLNGMNVIYTKEDEAFRNGLMASVSISKGIPACFVTNGQQIPEDIIKFSRSSELADLIFAGKGENI